MQPAPSPLVRKSIHRHLEDLPVLPTTVLRLMSLDRRSDTLFDELLALIEREPSYAARLLATANCAAYNRGTPVVRLRDALLRLGSGITADLIVAMSVVRVFVPANDWERALWAHSLTAATLARSLAGLCDPKQLGGEPEDAYLCGLLHDIGRFILFYRAPEALREVEAGGAAVDPIAAEVAVCGSDHATLGARAAERWRLPQSVVEVIRYHHADDPPRTTPMLELIRAIDRIDPADSSADLLSTEGDDDEQELLARLRLLPRWYPARPEALVPRIRQAMEQARVSTEMILR